MTLPKTLIELVDPIPEEADADRAVAHKAREVHINGTPVLVKAGTIHVEYGENELTAVTLTILPTELRFNRKVQS